MVFIGSLITLNLQKAGNKIMRNPLLGWRGPEAQERERKFIEFL